MRFKLFLFTLWKISILPSNQNKHSYIKEAHKARILAYPRKQSLRSTFQIYLKKRVAVKMKSFMILPLIGALSLVGLGTITGAVPCDNHIQKDNTFPDGYQARLVLPVLKATNGWKVEIEFDKNITVFDTPDGELENGVKSGRRFTILNYLHNGVLWAPSNLVIKFTVHYPRGIIPAPSIKTISFGNFLCQSKVPEVAKEDCIFAKELPLCAGFLTKKTIWPDGFQARLTLPIKQNVNSWQLLLIFSKQIKVLDFPEGDMNNKVNSREFRITSKDHNGSLKRGGTVSFEFTVHYERGQIGTNLVAVIFDPVQFICTNQKYKDILEQRYKNAANNNNPLIGANWIGGCEESVPECSNVFQLTQSWPDGFKGILKIPIKTDVNGWNITVYFDGKIRNFDVHQGDKVKALNGVYFVVKNYRHNARLISGAIFRFEITVHFSRALAKRPQVSVVRFRNEDVCENKDDCEN